MKQYGSKAEVHADIMILNFKISEIRTQINNINGQPLGTIDNYFDLKETKAGLYKELYILQNKKDKLLKEYELLP